MADLRAERTRLLYSTAHVGQITSLGIALFILLIFRDLVPDYRLIFWFVALLVVGAIRTAINLRFEVVSASDQRLALWHRRFVGGMIATALLMGNVWWLVGYQASFEQHLLLAFILGGLAVGAIPLLSASYGLYAIYATVIVCPAMIWFALMQTTRSLSMSALSLVFYLALLFTARGYNQTLTRQITLTSANQSLHAQQARLTDFASMGADLFWECDPTGRFIFLSDGCERLTGLPAVDLLDRTIGADDTLPLLPPDYLNRPASARHERVVDFSFSHRLASGGEVVLLSNAAPIISDDGQVVLGYRGILRDITEQHSLARQLQYQATHDDLTDLVNRREFERRLNSLLANAQTHGASHAVCYIDLDQFKSINDNCGHAAGDDLLRKVAAELGERLRSRDTLARLGGDEFGVLLEHCSAADALALANEMRESIAILNYEFEGQRFEVTASIGLASITAQSEDRGAIMQAVDDACYAAKDGGRNRVQQASLAASCE